jgi:parallel beta-helix repeat protein
MSVAGGFFVLALAGSPAQVEAICVPVTVTYGPVGSATLTGNINECGNPVVKVIGPFTLDMAGFTVACQVPGLTGVRLEGTGAILKNGVVQICVPLVGSGGIGVEVTGTGNTNHKVQNVVAKNNGKGFVVDSNKNELTNSSAVANAFGGGFVVNGNQNKLDKDTATDNDTANFKIAGNSNEVKNSLAAYGPCHGVLVSGASNKFTNNTSTGTTIPSCDGFHINVGSALNEFNGNVSSDNEGNGFNNEGNTNKFTNNTAIGNDQRGFRNHESNSNLIQNNVAVRNLDGIRLGSSSSSNLVKGNRTFGNTDDGIDVNGTNNTITENISLGNGRDLEDDQSTSGTPPCESNSWTSNIFGTSSDGCIR